MLDYDLFNPFMRDDDLDDRNAFFGVDSFNQKQSLFTALHKDRKAQRMDKGSGSPKAKPTDAR